MPLARLKVDGTCAEGTYMDDELRILHEAMVVKERLRVLAELQGTYWDELIARGFDGSVAEQLVLEWSRHAYGMTFRSVPEPSMDAGLDELLGDIEPAGPSGGARPEPGHRAHKDAPVRSAGDPSSVPPGESWLQIVPDEDPTPVDDAAADRRDDRAA